MKPTEPGRLKVLHLATHLNVGGITSYISGAGPAMIQRGHEVSVLSSGGEREEFLRREGVRVFRAPIRAKSELSPKIFLALPKVVRLVKKEKFDLLHAHTRVTQVLAALVSFVTRVPFLTTAHGHYSPRFGRRLFGCWGKRVVAVSPLVAEELGRLHGVPKSKIRVIFNAVDVPRYRQRLLERDAAAVRRELGIWETTFVVGSVARLVRDKGHAYLVEAAARLRRKHADIFLLIVGDGRERGRLEKLVRKFGLEKQSRLLPSQADITGVFSVMDVFVHPATFREGFGLAMLEAMIAKVPVVATNIWAVNSIVRDRVNGFLVEPKDPGGIERALSFIIENPDLAEAIAQNAFREASGLYSIDRMVGELETVYREVLCRN